MLGNMMKRQLNTHDILTYAADVYGDRTITSARVEGDVHRATYRETAARSKQLANALVRLGIQTSDRVATLAWNGYRHFELYYAITGMGAVCHTINPRLSEEQLIYIFNHAEDRMVFIDLTFVSLVEDLRDKLPADLTFVIMTDAAHMPQTSLPNVLCYEDLIAAEEASFDWPELDEDLACVLCYTSGTTGNPKGALYSHRSTVLHSFSAAVGFPNVLNAGSTILPVVPLFHVNAWGLPFSAPMAGANLVFPGRDLDGPSLFKLMDATETVSSWGVPTVWLGLLHEIQKQGRAPKGLSHAVIGGSAAPRSTIEALEGFGVDVCHAWGMTEMSPLGSHGQMFAPEADISLEEKLDFKGTQGRRMFGVEMKLVDENGACVPHDGQSVGELFVRGNAVISSYFNDAEASAGALDSEGWLSTGDVARIDGNGVMTITDRAKDLIKSGGEWISSIDVENMAATHPQIAECAVIGAYHEKWDERPLLIAVAKDGDTPDKAALLDFLSGGLAKWQVPDDIVFVDALPMTATGKISKLSLRAQYKDHLTAEA
jgi:fatty-acyl-CoA synthase